MYASPGVATSQHLFAELLKVMTGIDLRHIPYNGTAPAVVDIVAGRVSLMFAAAAPSLPLIKDGTLRALGVSSAARLAEAARHSADRGRRSGLRCVQLVDHAGAGRHAQRHREQAAWRTESRHGDRRTSRSSSPRSA